jgi:lauroyl/myristoyl acyltransferase
MADEPPLSQDLATVLEELPRGHLVEITRRAAVGSFGAMCRGLLGDTSVEDFLKSLFPELSDAQIPAVIKELALCSIRNTCWPQLLSLPGEWKVRTRCLTPKKAQSLRERKGPAIIAFWHHGATHMVSLGLHAIGVPALVIGARMPGGWFRRTVSGDMRFVMSGDARQSAVALKAALDRLRKGGVVVAAVDGSSGKERIELPFLGRKVLVAKGVAVLARLTGAQIIPALATWRDKSWSFDFRIYDPLPLPSLTSMKTDDWDSEVITMAVRHFEGVVRTFPGQCRLEKVASLLKCPRV